MIGALTAALLLLAVAAHRYRARALRWAQDDVDAEVFLSELSAVQPGALIRASVAPPRSVAPPKLRVVPSGGAR